MFLWDLKDNHVSLGSEKAIMFFWDLKDNHVSVGSERQGLTKMTKSDKNDNICKGIIKYIILPKV
jgi:hypothetical protein